MNARNEFEVEIKIYDGDVPNKYSKNKQKIDDVINGDRSTSTERPNKKSKVTHDNNDQCAQNMIKSFFYTWLCCNPKLLFLVAGSENIQTNFYHLMEDLSDMKANFNIALLNEVYPSKINSEKDLRGIMQNLLHNNSNETRCFIHLVKTFIA